MLEGPKTCRVSFTDRQGLTHSVTVSAGSRNEAGIRALAQFRKLLMPAEGIEWPQRDTKFTVTVTVEESHELVVADALEWLERHGRKPREVSLKAKLKELLEEQGARERPA